MRVCVNVCVCMHVYLCECVCMRVYVCEYLCMCMCVCACVCACVCCRGMHARKYLKLHEGFCVQTLEQRTREQDVVG